MLQQEMYTPMIEQMASTAERLRTVRAATRRFIAMWAMESTVLQAVDQMAEDLKGLGVRATATHPVPNRRLWADNSD